jgi:hypothetical protein
MGMTIKIATIRIGNPASEAELKTWTELVCPNDNRKPRYEPAMYECECGFKASTWQKLKRVIKGTAKVLNMPKLIIGGGEVEIADMYQIPMKKFIEIGAADCIDPRNAERPVLCDDPASIQSLRKILIAQESGQSQIILRWNDTTEQVIAMLALTPSGRIVVRQLIPKNLVRGLEGGIKMDKSQISQEDIDQVKIFLKQFPLATEKTFEVTDYRVKQFAAIGKETPSADSMVVAMEKMLEKVGITGKVENGEKATLKAKPKAKQKIKVPITVPAKRKKK